MMKLTLLTALIAIVSARSSYKCSPSGICYFVNDDQLRNYEESRAYCKEFDGQLPQLKSHLEQGMVQPELPGTGSVDCVARN
ncbi:hypothetical protein HDE_01596 [Halotydeus destructor]|nr:hypothetical protein HDE_01596 [Halotydeus destructor]